MEEAALTYSCPFELDLKALSDDGKFSGVLSVYGTVDLVGDVFDQGAWTKSLAEQSVYPLLWQHDRREVVGQIEARESGSNLLVDGTLDLDDPVAVRAYGKLKKRLVKGLSVGFQALKSTFEEVTVDGAKKFIRHIVEAKLWEGSIVTFPALPMATVTRVKDLGELSQFEERLVAAMRSGSPELRGELDRLMLPAKMKAAAEDGDGERVCQLLARFSADLRQ